MKEQCFTVSQVNRYIAQLFTEDFSLSRITVSGEISNLKYHPSGHVYFTLKDSDSQLASVLFAGDRSGLRFTLENGMKVQVQGRIGVYQRSGSYQLYAKTIKPDGIGELYLRFEQLKQELSEMGMFDPIYKKEIPPFARRIGIVTAKTGAAVRDIIQIARRRNPYVELILYPAVVQGEYAVPSIVAGIETLDRMGLDVLIVGRGGGSLEDLWAFNERAVAEAVFNADTPIISAVGHETDVTICDFVADLRAPTPSAAAELSTFDYREFMAGLQDRETQLRGGMERKLTDARAQLAFLKKRLSRENPKEVLRQERQRLLGLGERLQRSMQERIAQQRMRILQYPDLPGQMKARIAEARGRLQSYPDFSKWMAGRIDTKRAALSLAATRLEAVSPVRRLSSGFGYVQDDDGRRISSVRQVQAGESLTITLQDGSVQSRVEFIEEKAPLLREQKDAPQTGTGK